MLRKANVGLVINDHLDIARVKWARTSVISGRKIF